MKKLILVGGGGHCKSVIDSMDMSQYDDVAICDVPSKLGEKVLDIPISYCDTDFQHLFQRGFTEAFVTLGSVGNSTLRASLFEKLNAIGFSLISVVDSTAIVSTAATIGKGCFVGKGTIINAGVLVGQCCIINSGSIIEHDCTIGDFVHIAPGATLSGGVMVGNNSHIGVHATILQSIQVGHNCLVGAGSVVTKNVRARVKAFGNPCREVSEI